MSFSTPKGWEKDSDKLFIHNTGVNGGQLPVTLGPRHVSGDLLGRQAAHHLARHAEYQRTLRNARVLQHHRARPDQTVSADAGAA